MGAMDDDVLRRVVRSQPVPDRLLRDLRAAPRVPERNINAHVGSGGGDPSPRELDVLRCWAVGLTDVMTADTLGVAVETVRKHGRNVRYVLRGKTRTHAVANAIRQGLI